jgi:uncharacterized membrane protein YphA (DoxX/SURF4 family)
MNDHSQTKAQFFLTTWLYLRGLAVIYFFAFLSLSVQMIGLFGSDGILPAASFLKMVAANLGPERFWLLPTIFWLNCSDFLLVAVCVAGMFLSIAAFFGIGSLCCFIALWILYLSLLNIGQDFLSFQWDALLMEAGFLAIFITPWQPLEWPWRLYIGNFKFSSSFCEVPQWSIWLGRWLIFRLMFESGLAKIASGDDTWRNLSALYFHYLTQPLPTPLAWFAAQMPQQIDAVSVICMFIIELILPLFIFMGRKMRLIAFFGFVALQVLIAATGNYAYFNCLTLVLCIFLLDDQMIKNVISKVLTGNRAARNYLTEFLNDSDRFKSLSRGQKITSIIVAVFIFIISLGSLERGFAGIVPIPEFIKSLYGFSSSYFIANSYGLFAVMTTKRREIIIEGSNDGVVWQAYEFKYKPGSVNRELPIVAPHQPRLDWQMWFAALGDPIHDRWFINFMFRLLQGKNEVLSLLANNPFPEKPPQYVRALFYDYHFTNATEHQRSNVWWRRDFEGECAPPLSLKNR